MNNHIMNITISMLLFVLVGGCYQDETEIDNKIDFESYIQDEMNSQNIPAMSLLVFDKDTILYENYFGKTHIQQNILLENDHLFLLASISKVVTATALLQLYDQNLFSLDDEINDYLPFKVSVPNQSTPITFRMLLTHTSGIADGSALDNQYYYEQDSPTTLDYFLENYLVSGGEFYNASENYHNFEPGTQHEYSNEGSALIAVLVEQISNKDFNTFCKEGIFEPLGMSHTFWRLDESIQSNYSIVQPYNYKDGQFETVQHYTFTDYPNGGLRSTGKDMLSFLRAFIKNGNVNNYQLLTSSTISSMITPQIPTIDNEVGLHLFLMNSDLNL